MSFLNAIRRKGEAPTVDRTGLGVLEFLASHDLAATPENFALIHNYIADPQGLTARAVESVLLAGTALSAEMMVDLYQSYCAAHAQSGQGDSASETDGRSELRHQARQLAEVTAHAAMANGQFGRGLVSELDGIFDAPGTLVEQVRAMIDRTESTEKQLEDALGRIETLREQVEAERGNAARDALTGLLNRRGAQPMLDGAEPGDIIVMADLDRFKAMNDSHGHVVGDRVLKVVARSLRTSLEPHDVVRWGGEEFLILIQNVPIDAAAAMVDEARRDLKQRRLRLRETGKRLGSITMSAGLSVINGQGVIHALEQADAALYQAKEQGRDQIRVRPD